MDHSDTYAGFWQRLAAAVIDAAILGLVGYAIAFMTVVICGPTAIEQASPGHFRIVQGVPVSSIDMERPELKRSTDNQTGKFEEFSIGTVRVRQKIIEYQDLLNIWLFGLIFMVSAIDGIMVWMMPLLVCFFLLFATGEYNEGMSRLWWEPNPLKVCAFVAPLAIAIVNWLYHACLESSVKQATFGKQIMKLVVIDWSRQRISFAKATIRHFSKIVSSCLGIGFLMVCWTKDKQALHDKVAGCLVCKASGKP